MTQRSANEFPKDAHWTQILEEQLLGIACRRGVQIGVVGLPVTVGRIGDIAVYPASEEETNVPRAVKVISPETRVLLIRVFMMIPINCAVRCPIGVPSIATGWCKPSAATAGG